MTQLQVTVASLILTLGCCYAQIFPVPKVEDQQHWNSQAFGDIHDAILAATSQNWGIAKNIVLFVGDGMGITPSVAGRIYKGQKKYGQSGEEGYLSWEKFPHVSLLKTYNADRQVPDSAGTATAFLCGGKANYHTLGLDTSVKADDCLASLNPQTWQSSIMTWAQEGGKDTGFVTTTTVTHATPAALYAHTPNRHWECDSQMKLKGHGCRDIAKQLVHSSPGNKAKVILGGGRLLLGATTGITQKWICTRTDGRNLTKEWIQSKAAHGHQVSYVQNTQQLRNVDIHKTDYLMGLFATGHMSFETERVTGPTGQPSLAEMTSTAIRMLSKNRQQGFFLMVEGGKIDHALHDTKSKLGLEEIIAFDDAVNTALQMVDLSETLVIITADHSHGMTMNGYAMRGNNILGISEKSTVDKLPFTTLMYTNGPGYDHFYNGVNVTRPDVRTQDTTSKDYRPIVAVPNIIETHSGDDVTAYAIGPMAHLFHSLHEQTYVAHVMGFAACIGPYKENCSLPNANPSRFLPRQS